MPRKPIRLSYKRERCLLSDVLPYEIPISLSNKYFYDFILRNRIAIEEDTIVWLKDSEVLDRIIHLIFALPVNKDRVSDIKRFVGKQELDFRCYKLKKSSIEQYMIPFRYKIRHKENEFRELCVPHPISQLKIVDFYDRCKEVIIYYTSLSPFSIRAPSRISKYSFYKDFLHNRLLVNDSSIIEEVDKEYENLKSFFVYKQYSNIYKFYDSSQFHRNEKKFNKLIKLDVSKCFDSIYTHSIGWAILGKETEKLSLGKSNDTFPGRFDKLMSEMNYGETNGIIIGPEFSRIFAEIILQAIDRKLKLNLKDEKHLRNKIHYDIFRYVDDYFIFYNEDVERTVIVEELQHILRDYKLYLNISKAVEYEKPIITDISIAKQQISSLLKEAMNLSVEIGSDDEFKVTNDVKSKRLIAAYKAIIKSCGVAYMDVLNYTMSAVEQKCDRSLIKKLKLFEKTNAGSLPERPERQLISAISGILEFVFFIYSVSPRVNTTIRLCRILRLIVHFLKSITITPGQKQLIYKQIYDDIRLIIKKNRSEKQVQVETLYLLIALSELGKDYRLEEETLAGYFGISLDNNDNMKQSENFLNYFSITVVLFYMRDNCKYDTLRNHVVKVALEKFRNKPDTVTKDAELVFLLFDLISCPYIDEKDKHVALKMFGVSDSSLAMDIVQYAKSETKSQMWFTNWLNFDFGKELDAKRSHEVY